MLETVQFIRENGVDALTTRFSIEARRHPKYPNLVFLKYNQIASPMAEPVVQECRGLILDQDDDWRVVSYPFRKFFNHGEGHAANIDWSSACVYEKLDGSLMTLYWYDGAWRVASNGTPDAGGPVHGYAGVKTFADLFWRTWRECGYSLPDIPELCFMFELMTPYSRVVVQHAACRIVLLGARLVGDRYDFPAFREFAPSIARFWGWEVVRSFPLKTIDDCLKAAEVLNPMQSEGYVVCDAQFNRAKVKSPQYVALAHLKDTLSPRRMLELVRRNEGDEFLAHFPEMRGMHDEIKEQFESLVAELESHYATIRHIPQQKEFALAAQQCRCSSALFAVRAGGQG